MKVYVIFSSHWGESVIEGAYISEDAANKELERLNGLLTKDAGVHGYGYYLEDVEVIDGESGVSSDATATCESA